MVKVIPEEAHNGWCNGLENHDFRVKWVRLPPPPLPKKAMGGIPWRIDSLT